MVAQPRDTMRKLHLFAFLNLVALAACSFNPQPDPPGGTVENSSATGGGGSSSGTG